MKNKKEMKKWLVDMDLSHPLVIAGPCSAETEDQVLKVAHELKDTDVTIFRMGIWKPRTRPGDFEGVGTLALSWLKRVKEETGLMTAIEVANAFHVKLALKADIDVLWIGARTSVSPFSVQEIADALSGSEKIILVKNPVNPDLSLWLGGVERLYKMGIKNVGVIHRGFFLYDKTPFRNVPHWQLIIELKRQFPDLPIINDPSHICGNREGIQEISQIALDLNFDGLMIETHVNPDEAWSDPDQQITPSRLVEIMKNLKVRKKNSNKPRWGYPCELSTLIDIIDGHLIENLMERMKIMEKIGERGRSENMSIFQGNQWDVLLKKIMDKGKNQA